MDKITDFLVKHIKIVYIALALFILLFVFIVYNAIDMAKSSNDRYADEETVLYYEIPTDNIFLGSYKEKDSWDDDYAYYSPVFATLMNECGADRAYNYYRFFVDDDTVVVCVHQKSDDELCEMRAFHINSWTGWN